MTQTIVRIRGIISNKIQTKTGNKFSFKNLDTGKDECAITFGKFELDWLGEEVKFDGVYNEKFKNYAVKGEVELCGGATSSDADAPTVTNDTAKDTEPKRRGRPKKVEAVASSLSSDVESIVLENLVAAKSIVFTLKLEDVSVTDLVALADMVGRTKVSLKIEAGKDRRMKEFRK